MAQEVQGTGDRSEVRAADAVMAQLYRGELSRSDRWRMRLDTTSNWALTTAVGVISFSFSNVNFPHVPLLVGLWMVISFLGVEARRYRYYDLWNRRLRLLEHGFWGPLLRREPEDPDAMRELASELERPVLRLSMASAVATRLHRVYGSILLVMVSAWLMKLWAHPTTAGSPAEIARRAHVGLVPGPLVLGVVAGGMLLAAALFISSFVARAPLGELRPAPRSRRRALWEAFARPYELAPPRVPQRRRAKASELQPPEGARSAPP